MIAGLGLSRLRLRAPLRKAPASRLNKARRTVLAFLFFSLAVNVILSIGMDTVWPSVRDAEFTSRRVRIEARVQAHPGRPLAIVLGSSRTDFGIRPLVADQGPLVCNASQVGSGPLLELLTLRRLLHDGIAPKELIVEFWPPFLMSGPRYGEFIRLDPHRYFPSDEQFIRDYLPDPDETLRLLREIRRTPVWNHRERLLSRTLPSWLPNERRLDSTVFRVDEAGWLAGPGIHANPDAALARAAGYYQPLFAEYAIAPVAERALREIIATGHSRGMKVTLVWMPESSAFRSWYPSAVEAAVSALLTRLHEQTGVQIVITRDWMKDDCFPDGFHLTPDGSVEFTRRFFAMRP